MPPVVSVALTARNASPTIEEAIDSILRQSLSSLELILVDHSSFDNTLRLMKESATRDSRVRVYQCDGTFVEAANLAWKEGNANLIARMDADDIAHPDRLAEQVAFLGSHPDIAACGTQVRILKRSQLSNSLPADPGYLRYEEWVNSVISPEDIRNQRFVDSPLPHPTTMIRRSAIQGLQGYSEVPWAEDYDFWLRMLEAGHRLGKVAKPLLEWYDGDNRATRTDPRYTLSRFQQAKAHYLSRIEALRERGVAICGAGPIGKEFAGLCHENGVPVHAFLEVNERKVGNSIGNVPVVSSTTIGEFRSRAVLIGAVGLSGARDRIRKLAIAAGFREGRDFFCVA